jgi:hypothetical protein
MINSAVTVDNIFVGHDASDAKALAKETFHVKRTFEKDAEELEDEEIEGKIGYQDLIKLKLMQFRSKSTTGGLFNRTED